MADGHGNSRAAQKKRKKLLKRKSCEIADLKLPEYQDDSFVQEEEELENEKISFQINKDQSKGKKKSKSNNLFEREYFTSKYLENLSEMSFNDILELKNIVEVESKEKASLILSKIISPTNYNNFYSEFWEKNILHCQREGTNIAKEICNKKSLKTLITENVLIIEEDINIIGFDSSENTNQLNDQINNLKKVNFLKQFQAGSALELLQPQKIDDKLWKFMSSFEFEFGSRISSTIIYQPPSHSYYDAIKAEVCDNFIFQVDGKSTLILVSNDNIEDQTNQQLEIIMNQGDSLYIPKKYSASLIGDDQFENITMRFSMNFSNSVSDILKLILPQALDSLTEDTPKFKKSLRPDIRRFISIAASENDDDPTRESIKTEFSTFMNQVITRSMDMLDPASDQWSKTFIAERLPVFLSEEEEMHSAASNPNATIFPYTQLRMIRPGIAIVVVEDGKVVLYHCMDNSRELFGNPLNPLEFEVDDGPAIELLLNAYPNPITVSDLDHPSGELEDKIGVAQALYKEGILLIADQISQTVEEEDSDSDDPF